MDRIGNLLGTHNVQDCDGAEGPEERRKRLKLTE